MAIRIDGTNTTANPGITGADTDTGLQVGTNELKLVTGGSEAVTVDSSQNVGIGTTTPAEPLEVVAASSVIKSRSSGNYTAKLILDSDRAAGAIGGQIRGYWNGNEVARIDFVNGADDTNKDDGEIAFGS